MAIEIQFDTIDDASIVRTIRGDEIIRTAVVSGLDNTISATLKLSAAMAVQGVPVVGRDFYPDRPDLVCTRIEGRAEDREIVRLTITYGVPVFDFADIGPEGQAQLEGGSTIQSVQTSKDVNGNPIILEHNVPVRDESGNIKIDDQGQPITRLVREDPARVDVSISMIDFSLTQIRTSSPMGQAREFSNKVNSLNWFGFAPTEVLLARVRFSSNDGGQTFSTRYEFQVHPETWLANLVLHDPVTGRIAEGVPIVPITLVNAQGQPNPPAGHMLVQVYKSIDFNLLGLESDGVLSIGSLPVVNAGNVVGPR